ncbi:MAG TPA: cytochrome biogenesis protein ResB [Marinobacter hydrocarbonoclasticus]|uniref:Cytochrome biogenesis protein ResB n=1 Tax=Marinobacter nauticus TaxID=2743 RepID=A0A3B8WDN2_MARNT|nr:cytochrome biogenesis protein ResB [Marinobacter nauticus]HIO02643.1 c-type cytochrome [Alphaproteobacteria bacterium]
MLGSSHLRKLMIVVGLAASQMVSASPADDAMSQLNAIMADDAKRQASYEAGHERIRFCGYCHGEDGNSKREYIPNLAAQHPLYLFNQFEKFRDGTREDYVMSKLAKTLSLEERINIAVYYSQQTAKPRTGGDPTKAEAGEKLFAVRCAGCHGDKAQGFRDMPRLAGQPAEYLGIALRRFKEMDPTKHSTPMIGVAGVLSEGQIEALISYLTRQ